MRTKNILIVMAALALCCFASSCVKQKDFDSFTEETDSHLSTVEGQMASLKELTATLGEEHDALKVYVAALGEGFEEYAAEVNALLEVLDRRLDAAEDTIPTFAEMSYVKSTFATITVVDSLSKVTAAIKVKVQSDSTVLADSINKKTAASEKKFMDLFGSYYTSAEIDAKIKVLSDKLDTLFSDMDTAVFKHIEALKTDVEALGTSSAALAKKLDEEVAALKQQDTVFIKQIDSLDKAYKDTLISLDSIVGENAKRIQELESRVKKLEGRVQSVRVVPDYSDGKVNMKKGDTEIKFDVRPVSAAKALAAKTSAFSFQVIEALATTKASIYTDVTVKSAKMSGVDSLLVLTVDGTTMPADFFTGAKLYNARLRISDAATGTDCSSSYFPLTIAYSFDQDTLSVSKSASYTVTLQIGGSPVTDAKTADFSLVGTTGISVTDVTAGVVTVTVQAAATAGTDARLQYKKNGAGKVRAETVIELISYPEASGLTCIKIAGIWWAPVNCGYDATHTYGLVYQWGRKYGQGWENETPACSITTDRPSTVADGSSTANKDKFFKEQTIWTTATSSLSDDWFTTYNPCPSGWRVPTVAELTALKDAGSSWTTQGGLNGRLFASKLFLPAAGQRYYYYGQCESRGNYGFYWSSSPSPTSVDCASRMYFDKTWGVGTKGDFRACGYSIRCVYAK